jgi:hypothetical protein
MPAHGNRVIVLRAIDKLIDAHAKARKRSIAPRTENREPAW